MSCALVAVGSQALILNSGPDPGADGMIRGDAPAPAPWSWGFMPADWVFDAEAPVLSSPNVADLDGDSILDVVLTTYGRDPNPYGSGYVYALDIQGDTLPGWPKVTSAPFAAGAVVGDVDGDGGAEVVTGDWARAYVWNGDGTNVPGWPKSIGTYSAPALADMDTDGDLDIVYCGADMNLYVWDASGASLPGWPIASSELVGTPAIADIDGDSLPEIVAATYRGPVGPDSFQVYVWEVDGNVAPGFPFWTSGVNKSAPAVGDVDADDSLEIVVASYHTSDLDYLYLIGPDGNLENGWPVRAGYIRLSSPALGDIDGDGDLEILIGGYDSAIPDEEVFAYHHDGSPVVGWPVLLSHPGAVGNINSSVIAADIDGTHAVYETCWPLSKRDCRGTALYPPGGIFFHEPEILVKAVDHIFALHPDGSVVNGFPYFLDDESHTGTQSPSPAVADMDGDGDPELLFASCSGILAFLDYESQGVLDDVRWMGRAGTGQLEVFPNPFRTRTLIRSRSGEVIQIFDVAGRLVRESSGRSMEWDGCDGQGEELPSGIYLVLARGASQEFRTRASLVR